MDRETFLKSIGGGMAAMMLLDGCSREERPERADGKSAAVSAVSMLEGYKGPFTEEMAAHLLRRTTFGATAGEIRECAALGLDRTIDLLFADRPLPDPPLNYEFERDPFVEIGETWIEAPYLRNDFVIQPYRRKSIRAWILGVIYDEGISIREQLTFFWMNHFGVTGLFEHKFEYIHNQLMRTFAWGNFRELVKKVTIDPAMLVFLNGRDSTQRSPNENYARELLELFTVGKGPLAGEGDYTTFTEHDVRQAAIALTGWEDVGHFSFNKHIPIGAKYTLHRHANKAVTLSERFGNARIPATGARQYADLIDVIFESPNTALHICRKLYRWFVNADIDEQIERDVIRPMAVQLRAAEYEIEPVLRGLLKSRHFFDQCLKSQKIKNPVEFVVGTLRQFEIATPGDMFDRYTFWYELFEVTYAMGMGYFIPPGVAGWKPYYQAPAYYKLWINAATMQIRNNYVSDVFRHYPDAYSAVNMNYRSLLSELLRNSGGEPEELVNAFSATYLARPLTDVQRSALAQTLAGPYRPDEWASMCSRYMASGSAAGEAQEVEQRLTAFLKEVFNMTEFQLI